VVVGSVGRASVAFPRHISPVLLLALTPGLSLQHKPVLPITVKNCGGSTTIRDGPMNNGERETRLLLVHVSIAVEVVFSK
jgi:hypothetical protein